MTNYIQQLNWLNIFIISFLIWLVILLIKKNILHKGLLFIEIIYVFVILIILFFPENTLHRNNIDYINYNLQLSPFKQLNSYLANKNYIALLGNTFILFPVPIFLMLNKVRFKTNIIISFILVILIEPIQFLINIITEYPNKVIDIDDFILELSGILLGLIIACLINKIILSRQDNNFM